MTNFKVKTTKEKDISKKDSITTCTVNKIITINRTRTIGIIDSMIRIIGIIDKKNNSIKEMMSIQIK